MWMKDDSGGKEKNIKVKYSGFIWPGRVNIEITDSIYSYRYSPYYPITIT